ncbi:fumarylacetoacetate hydrolase family protein [Lederbergia citrea]|uniref:fumarylacetoacetate hydrolase family protein n=1 Tax=Lederbergia citrea TaxID=2833581 RepID=UPI001BC8D687|nr:fumarylacetoacetate hydrolase family protein [Lederbergia citrea]MBS4178946.1 fumarylacetoacetate hydrolase family protein [Lederbergia citrea]MBS4205627.1 fumarylacetoacetate hydrolase family protein [Lederbergia citrea]
MSRAKAILCGSNDWMELLVNPVDSTVEMNGKTNNVSELLWNPPVSGTIYGTLLNYRGQLEKIKAELNHPPYNEPPKAPILYLKPFNTVTACNWPIPLPTGVSELEVGAALGVVIGKKAIRVYPEEAMNYIEGYTIVNDVSIPHDSFFRPAIKQKARDGFCPVGPWIICRDAVSDPGQLDIRVYVNGKLKQENNTRHLIRSIPLLIAEVTEFMTLNRGDILLAGVPEKAPLVKEGDHIRIEISEVGALENTVVPEGELSI